MLVTAKTQMRYPMGLERRYAKELRSYVRKELKFWRDEIPYMAAETLRNAIHKDEDNAEEEEESDWIEALLLLLLLRFKRQSREELRRRVIDMFGDVVRHARAEYDRVTSSVFGSSRIPTISRERDIERMRDMFIRQNLGLLDSVDDGIKEGLYYVIDKNAIASADRKAVEKQIADYLTKQAHIPENRAVLIGADQVGKLFGQLNQYNQMADGVEWYIWRTMNDSRVRETHQEREGKAYKWSEPPPDGHPGQPIRCRCHAESLYDVQELGMTPMAGKYHEYVQGKRNGVPVLVEKGPMNVATRKKRK